MAFTFMDNFGVGSGTPLDNSSQGISSPDWNFGGMFNGNNTKNRAAYKQQVFNASQAELNRNFNASQAQINRDFQRQMSNSAVQRRVADMKAAGINPILAAGASASSPNGSTASGSAASANQPNLNGILKDLQGLFLSAAKLAKR